MTVSSLQRLEAADRMLAEAKDLYDIAQIRDIATAARAYAKAAQLGIDATNKAAEIKIRAERKAGEFLKQLETNPHGGDRKSSAQPENLISEYNATLTDVGIARSTAHRWQKSAEIPEPIFEKHIAEVKAERDELTSAGVLRLAGNIKKCATCGELWAVDSPYCPYCHTSAEARQAHAKMQSSSGRNLDALMTSNSDEWYTTPDIIDVVLSAFGGQIDLDPCSNSRESPNVPAATYYTKDDDGLAQVWAGRVYVNPPYGNQIPLWVDKCIEAYESGCEIIMLIPSRTDTRWFRRLKPFARCFMWGRVRFNNHENSAPFPTMLVYLGDNRSNFVEAVKDMGDVYVSI